MHVRFFFSFVCPHFVMYRTRQCTSILWAPPPPPFCKYREVIYLPCFTFYWRFNDPFHILGNTVLISRYRYKWRKKVTTWILFIPLINFIKVFPYYCLLSENFGWNLFIRENLYVHLVVHGLLPANLQCI